MKNLIRKWRGCGAAALLAAALAAQAQPEVETLGGGPNQSGPSKSGYVDGDTFEFAKFRNPYSIAIDTNGNLLIADQANNKLRKVSKPGEPDSLTSTLISKLSSPVGVAVDGSNTIYVVTQKDGKVRQYTATGTLLKTYTGFKTPTAIALDAYNRILVAELGGRIYRISSNDMVTLVGSGFRKPRGLAVQGDGLVAITESSGHAIALLNPETTVATILAGNNGKGFVDGPAGEAKFNGPYGIVAAPNGALVVADRYNHRVRVIDTNHMVTTLYGVSSKQWFKSFPGWVDGEGGSEGVAAAREPVGLSIAANGDVFAGEVYWDILRRVVNTGLGVTNAPDNGTNVTTTNVLAAPTFFPNYGYFPFGVTVTVTSAAPVYYTTDGSIPTTSSPSVPLIANVGTLRFTDNLRDLTSLRLKAISDTGESPVTGGRTAPVSEFGIPRDFVAGSGATVLVPVVANLRTNERIQSFQYRVEITPLNGAPPVLPYLRAASIGTNDFVPLVTSAAQGKVARYSTSRYTIGNTLGLVVSASGTNSFVDFEKFATTAMLVVPVDPAAQDGHAYRIEVLYPSATSDGYGSPISVVTGAPRTITVSGLSYLVGDTAPGTGYNAGEFGNLDLQNNDANGVLFASVGLRVPFEFSDVFNAMDAFPPEPTAFGGDGRIEFADWQVVLNRSLRLDLDNWTRSWFMGGLQSDPVPLVAAAPLAKSARLVKSLSTSKTAVPETWSRGATLVAGNVHNTGLGYCEVPVSLKVAPGQTVGGLAFRVVIESEGGSPSVSDVSFQPMLGQSGFVTAAGGARNDIVCAWSMVPSSPFTPVLSGQQLLGNVTFTVPANAVPGNHYTVRFLRPSGAADLNTAVSFEGIPGSAWVLWTPGEPGQQTSDEWRVNYFGSTDAPEAADLADPDGDNTPNWQEYLNGTNPTENL